MTIGAGGWIVLGKRHGCSQRHSSTRRDLGCFPHLRPRWPRARKRVAEAEITWYHWLLRFAPDETYNMPLISGFDGKNLAQERRAFTAPNGRIASHACAPRFPPERVREAAPARQRGLAARAAACAPGLCPREAPCLVMMTHDRTRRSPTPCSAVGDAADGEASRPVLCVHARGARVGLALYTAGDALQLTESALEPLTGAASPLQRAVRAHRPARVYACARVDAAVLDALHGANDDDACGDTGCDGESVYNWPAPSQAGAQQQREEDASAWIRLVSSRHFAPAQVASLFF